MFNLQHEIDTVLQSLDSQLNSALLSPDQQLQAKDVKTQAVTKVKSIDELLKRLDDIFKDEN